MADKPAFAIPRTIWALGFVSLFMDLSSELIHSLLPVFLVSTLGASALTVGVIEGIAEATAHIVKVFSGSISDFFGRRKVLLIIGYGMAALSKPLFPMADSVVTVFIARFMDRIGKGIRGAPRDALIADVASAEIRGACFGLRQSLDTVGAFLGPMAAILLLFLLHGDITAVLWFAVVPSVLAVLVIVLAVDEPTIHDSRHISKSPLRGFHLKQFSVHFWWVILIGVFFTLARFSEAFLVLRAQQNGLSINWIPAIMVIMSLAYALSAYPVGRLSDRINKKWLLGISLLWLIISDMVLALAHGALAMPMLFIGVACWGLHMGFSQGTLATLVAETTPQHLKGTAFGVFNFISGVFMLLASLIAGGVWTYYGAEFTFYCGAGFALLAMVVLVVESRLKHTVRD